MMKRKICMMILCSLLLNLLSVAPAEAKTKNPVKTYRLKATTFEVQQGKSAKISLQLLKGKKKVKFSKKTKTEKLSTKFKVSYRDADNGTVSVSKNGVIKTSVKRTAEIDQSIGEIRVTITLKKKNKKKWKSYSKKMKVSIYASDGHIPATATPTMRPYGFVSDNNSVPQFVADPTPVPTATPTPTAKPTPKPTKKPTPTPTVKPTATPFKPSDEWTNQVPGAYNGQHVLKFTWEQLEEAGKVEVEGTTLKKITWGARTDIYEDTTHAIVLPNTITTIGSYAFADYAPPIEDDHGYLYPGYEEVNKTNFEDFKYRDSLILPDSLTTIEDYAFYDCDSIKVLEIPQNVTSIGNYAFYSCSALLAIKLPEGLKSIGESAFSRCIDLRACNFPSTVESVGKEAFYNDGLIGHKDWYYLNNELVLHVLGYEDDMDVCATLDLTNVKEIGRAAFCGHGASSVKWSKHIKTIPESCFCGCGALKTVEIPEGITGIEFHAFDWDPIKKLILPESIENIGFQSWDKLPEVECNKTLEWESEIKNPDTEDEYYNYWVGDRLFGYETEESSE